MITKITKARTIRIGAGLLEELWPEIVKAAGYLTKRPPSRQIDWKTPLESLYLSLGITNPRPIITHLKAYGCRAYPLNHRIPRTKKLEPRARVGCLVGYESTNIFRIWILSEERVVATRDVTFQEMVFYDPKEPDLVSQLRERADQKPEVIEGSHTPRPSIDNDIDTDTDDGEDSQERSLEGPEQTGLPTDSLETSDDNSTPQPPEEANRTNPLHYQHRRIRHNRHTMRLERLWVTLILRMSYKDLVRDDQQRRYDDRLTLQTWTDLKNCPDITQHLPPEFNTVVAASIETRCRHHLVHGRHVLIPYGCHQGISESQTPQHHPTASKNV
jgi:hypothetical protein